MYWSFVADSVALLNTCAASCVFRRKLNAYKELEQRMKRHKSLARTAAHLAMEKEVASKGRKRKLSKKEITENVGDDGRTAKKQKVFKWKRERKK